MAVAEKLPIQGVHLLLGNDLVNGRGSDHVVPVLKDPLMGPGVAVTTRSGVQTEEDDLDLNFNVSILGLDEIEDQEILSLQRISKIPLIHM